jgi:molybdopterin-guanine dinucleotide biosynthesis protein
MRQPNPKHEVLLKLQDIINSYDDIDLWREIGKLARTLDYILIEDFYERILKELEVIEQHIGEAKEVKELKDLIASLITSPFPAVASQSVA